MNFEIIGKLFCYAKTTGHPSFTEQKWTIHTLFLPTINSWYLFCQLFLEIPYVNLFDFVM